MPSHDSDLAKAYQAQVALVPQALTPFYRQSKPDEPIGLYRGGLRELNRGDGTVYPGVIFLGWRPSPWIRFKASDPHQFPFHRFFDADFELGPSESSEVPGQVALGNEDPEEMEGQVRGLRVGSDRQVSSVSFELPNFDDFIGKPIRWGSKLYSGRLELSAEPWRVTIDARPDIAEQVEVLRRNGGYLFTHTGRLRRTDGKAFPIEDVETVLDALFHFLSFARGAFTGPLLTVGYADDGTPAWAHWTSIKVDPSTPSVSLAS